MQRDHVLKKLNFDLLTPRIGRVVCEQNISYHAAAFVIPFYLICNMTMNFDLLIPTAKGQLGGNLWEKYLLTCCYHCDSL